MREKKDTVKDIVVGGTAMLATAANAPALIAAAAGTLAAVGWNQVAGSAQRRAKKLIERMIESDEEPATFAEHIEQRLEAGDDEALSVFRELLMRAVQAVSPDAIAPMGFVGRTYFYGRCSLQLARSALELLNNVTATDLQHLRQLTAEVAAVEGQHITIVTDEPATATGDFRGWSAWPDEVPSSRQAITVTPFGDPMPLFGYLKRAGLGHDSGGFGIEGSPRAIVMSRAAILLLRDALSAVPADTNT